MRIGACSGVIATTIMRRFWRRQRGERVSTFFGVLGNSGSGLQAARTFVRQFVERAAADSRPVAVLEPSLAAAASDRTQPCVAATFGAVSLAWVGRPRAATSADGAAAALDAATAAARFGESGGRALDGLQGAFALVIFDSARARGLVATDRMGIQPLFVKALPHGIAFATSPADVIAMLGETPRLSSQAVFDYLYSHVIPAPHTIFEGVVRLLPGECIEIENGKVSRRLYWRPRFEERTNPGFAALQKSFVETLRNSVQQAMQGARCGAFLSGGTDSSTIAGMMAQAGGEPPSTFSIGFDVGGYDEMEYARLASRHFKTRHHERYVTPRDVVAALPRLVTAHPQPFGNSSALPTYFCAKLAQEHGIERLLGGDGGDELFGGNARYAKQHIFSLYERIPAVLRSSLIEPMCRATTRVGRLPLVGKVASYVEQASVPMPGRLETYNLLQRTGYGEVLHEQLLAAVDTTEPARLNEDSYFNPTAASLINRMLALDFKTTLADSDLPKVVQACALAGLDVAFPLLDARVVDFSLALPPRLKLKGTQLRYFFKRALRGFLPDEIIRKQKHGFGLPFGEWAISDPELRALTFDTLNHLKRREIVRPQFIDRLKDSLLPQYPHYYGAMAWILMSLELWLADNLQRAATPAIAHAEPA
jgi:asparagine synthase (glutamine-hydrolysing)